jgi:hypothetical protein
MYPVAGMCILCDEPQTMFHFIEILGESCHTSRFPPKWELISAPLEREACDLILMDADPSSIDAMTLLGQLKCRQDHRHVAENVGGAFQPDAGAGQKLAETLSCSPCQNANRPPTSWLGVSN